MADPPRNADIDDDTGVGSGRQSTNGPPRWVKAFAVIIAIVLLVFVIVMFARGPGGRGDHGPGRHLSSGHLGSHTPDATRSAALGSDDPLRWRRA